MEDILAEEKSFLRTNLKELQTRYPGKYLLIRGKKVYGSFETFDEGVEYGVSTIPGRPFLVRNVMHPEDEAANVPALALGIPLTCGS